MTAANDESFRDRTHEQWVAALEDPNESVRFDAVRALNLGGGCCPSTRECTPESTRFAPQLKRLTQDPSLRVREGAILILANLALNDEEIIQIFLEWRDASSGSTRCGALKGLARSGIRDERVVSAFVKALADPLDDVRHAALNGLQGVRPVPVTAVEPLRALLNSESPWLRRDAAKVLVDFMEESDGAACAVRQSISSEDRAAVLSVSVALLQRTPDDKEAVRRLLEAAESAPERELPHTVFALAELKTPPHELRPLLAPRLSSSDTYTRVMVALVLVKSGLRDVSVLPALLEGLEHPAESTRTVAAATLARLGSVAARATPALTKALKDRSPQVAEWAKYALACLRGEIKPP